MGLAFYILTINEFTKLKWLVLQNSYVTFHSYFVNIKFRILLEMLFTFVESQWSASLLLSVVACMCACKHCSSQNSVNLIYFLLGLQSLVLIYNTSCQNDKSILFTWHFLPLLAEVFF